MISQLWMKDTYLNRQIHALFDTIIVEYDLSSANTSLSREYNLLPTSTIDELEALPSQKRKVQFGKIMRKDKEVSKKLGRAFEDIRRRFVEANNIEDEDILSIKKDALFIIDPVFKVKNTKFGHCFFQNKNTYHSYLHLNGIELYFYNDGVDVKGINDSYVEKHKPYILDFLKTIVRLKIDGKLNSLYRKIRSFVTDYKLGNLDPNYYREFNPNSLFILLNSDLVFKDVEFISPELKIDKTYNFENVIKPVLKIMLA